MKGDEHPRCIRVQRHGRWVEHIRVVGIRARRLRQEGAEPGDCNLAPLRRHKLAARATAACRPVTSGATSSTRASTPMPDNMASANKPRRHARLHHQVNRAAPARQELRARRHAAAPDRFAIPQAVQQRARAHPRVVGKGCAADDQAGFGREQPTPRAPIREVHDQCLGRRIGNQQHRMRRRFRFRPQRSNASRTACAPPFLAAFLASSRGLFPRLGSVLVCSPGLAITRAPSGLLGIDGCQGEAVDARLAIAAFGDGDEQPGERAAASAGQFHVTMRLDRERRRGEHGLARRSR